MNNTVDYFRNGKDLFKNKQSSIPQNSYSKNSCMAKNTKGGFIVSRCRLAPLHHKTAYSYLHPNGFI